MPDENVLDIQKALRGEPTRNDSVFSLEKALDTSAGTTGAVLIPEVIDAGLRMFVEERSPLWNIIQKEQIDGYAYMYREMNGLPVASFGAELGALPAAQNATYAERIVPVKSIYIRGELSGQIIAASRTLVNILQREIDNSAMGMVRTLEQKIVAGDSTAQPNEFDGLNKWITNVLDPGTAVPLTLAILDQGLDTAPGGPGTHIIMSQAMRRKLWSLLQPQVRYIDTVEVAGGFRVPSYMGLPIIDLFDNSAILNTTILIPDMRLVRMPILQPLTYEELAHTRDSIDYVLKMYLTLVVEGAARYHAKIVDLVSTIP